VFFNDQKSNTCARGLLRDAKEIEICNEESLIFGGLICFINS
jgi:hypothetical protein